MPNNDRPIAEEGELFATHIGGAATLEGVMMRGRRLSRQEVIARDAIVIPSGKKPVVRDSIAILSSKKPAWDTCQMTSRQQACRCPIEPSVRARLRA